MRLVACGKMSSQKKREFNENTEGKKEKKNQ
jgi:hypothetical protein